MSPLYGNHESAASNVSPSVNADGKGLLCSDRLYYSRSKEFLCDYLENDLMFLFCGDILKKIIESYLNVVICACTTNAVGELILHPECM